MNCAINELYKGIHRQWSTKDQIYAGYQWLPRQSAVLPTFQCYLERTISSTANKPPNKKKYFLTLPYINEQHIRKVHQILRKNKLLECIRVSFQHDKSLKTRSALRPTPYNKQNASKCYQCDNNCMIKNITYILTCNICEEEYVGETGRLKRNRCWEHYKSVRDGNNKTAMGNHYLKAHPDIVDIQGLEPFKFDLIDKCKDFVDRQIKQSQLIKSTTRQE